MIRAVYVRKVPGLFFLCNADQIGFICGTCGRGRITPKKGARCRVCKATVAQVVTDKYFVFGSRIRPIDF